jgi:Tfp pilus assembly protein PilE
MTVKNWWICVAIAAVLALAALGGYEWLQERDARLKAQTATAAQQKTIDQAKQDAQTVQQTLATKMKTLEAERKQPVTPQRFVVDLSKAIPGLPQQVTVVQAAPVQQTVDGKITELPSAPAVQIPAADLPALQDYRITCDETTAKLDACSKTAADTQTELQATTAQRDEWKTAAKGGNWWHRTLTAGKWIVIGGAVGYAAGRKW